MQSKGLSRRDILKLAAAAGGIAAVDAMLGSVPSLAEGDGAEGALGPFGPWSDFAPIDELASNSDDFHPAISRDGRSLYFTTSRDKAAGFPNEIVVSQRADRDAAWGKPQPLTSLNARGWTSAAPNLVPNGHLMYFQSNRGGHGGDLYFSYRQHTHDDFAWGAPLPVPGLLNTTDNSESAATYFQDPATGAVRLYFSRFHGIGMFSNQNQDWNIYVSSLNADGTFGEGVIVPPLNSVQQPGDPPGTWTRDTRTAIRRDGLEMFITSNRHGGLSYSGSSVENLWVATRIDTTSEDWTTPQLVPNLNSGFGEGGPALSWDGTTLYFFSARSHTATPGHQQLWMSTRSKLGR
jgi:WD40-like Beta Propeller Repeat